MITRLEGYAGNARLAGEFRRYIIFIFPPLPPRTINYSIFVAALVHRRVFITRSSGQFFAFCVRPSAFDRQLRRQKRVSGQNTFRVFTIRNTVTAIGGNPRAVRYRRRRTGASINRPKKEKTKNSATVSFPVQIVYRVLAGTRIHPAVRVTTCSPAL